MAKMSTVGVPPPPPAIPPTPVDPPLPPVSVTPPSPEPPVEDPNATIGAIMESPPPPESIGAPVFHTPTPEELAAFGAIDVDPAFPPPVAPPTEPEPPPARMRNDMHGQSSESGDGTAGDYGSRPHAPVPVITAPAVPPDELAFEQLSERTKAELRAGHAALGSREPFQYRPPVDTPPPPPTAAELAAAPPVPDVVDWNTVSLKTRLELEAGQRRLKERDTDYRAVQARVKEQQARDLADNKVGSLDYPAR